MTDRKAQIAYWAGEQFWGCTDSVYSSGMWNSSRCSKRAKHDPDADGNPTKCGVHSDAAKAKRKAKSDARYAEWIAKSNKAANIRKINAEMRPLIEAIAAGHNDPRGACLEWLARLENAKEAT